MVFVFWFCHQMFVKSNQGDEETTKINYLTFIGTPVQATNMNDFKRVWTSRDKLHSCTFRFVCTCAVLMHCSVLLPCRLWERKERVTEQENQGENEKKRKTRLQIHPGLSLCQSCHIALLSQTHTHTNTHTHAHSLQLTSSISE